MAIQVTEYSGMSITSDPVKVVTSYSGISIVSEWTLRVEIFDADTLLPITSSFVLVNNSDLSDPLTNNTSSDVHQHFITVENPSNLEFSFDKDGYDSEVQNYSYSGGNSEYLPIFLTPENNAVFSCTTVVKNDQDVVVSQPVEGRDNYIEVTFTSTNELLHFNYDVFFKAQLNGSNKFNYVPITDYELVNSTTNSVTYRYMALEGDYNYMSRIMSKSESDVSLPSDFNEDFNLDFNA